MRTSLSAPLIAAALLATCRPCGADPGPNLILNPSFEAAPAGPGAPAGWTTYEDPKARPAYAVEPGGHSEAQCASVSLASAGRAILVSQRIPVAPGDTLEASVWARAEGLQPDPGGGVAFTIGCVSPAGTYFRWFRFPQAQLGRDWTRLSARVEVPGGVSEVALQLGLSYCAGKVFFDDAALSAAGAIALRIHGGEVREMRPEGDGLTVTIINRDRRKAKAQLSMTVGAGKASQQVELTGEQAQEVKALVSAAPGAATARAVLKQNGLKLAQSAPEPVAVLGQVELEPLEPTHWCIEDGQPRVRGRLSVHLPKERLAGAKLSVRLLDSGGREIGTRQIDAPPPGKTDFEIQAPGATAGDYRAEARLQLQDGQAFTAAQDWHVISRRQARVTLNDEGFPVCDGRAIFPLGTFNSGRYDLMKKLGFTVVHAWNRARAANPDRPRHQPAKSFLDDAQRAGLKAVLMAPSDLARAGKWDEVARRVRIFRNHPALLVWDQEEGVARGEMPLATLRRLVEIVRREDPNHPFCLADTYDTIDKVDRSRFFVDTLMDIGMWWFYPIPPGGGEEGALEGRQASASDELAPPSFLAAPNTGKPIWVGLQAYRPPKRADGRLPTPQEYRQMAFLALAHGAKGLLYYMGGSANRTEDGTGERPWAYLHDLVPQIAAVAPAFMTPAHPENPRVRPSGALISTAARRQGGVTTIVAVNRSPVPVSARIEHSAFSGSVRVLFEDRQIAAESGAVHDEFAAYGVHIYEAR